MRQLMVDWRGGGIGHRSQRQSHVSHRLQCAASSKAKRLGCKSSIKSGEGGATSASTTSCLPIGRLEDTAIEQQRDFGTMTLALLGQGDQDAIALTDVEADESSARRHGGSFRRT